MKEKAMTSRVLTFGVALGLLLASGAAYADDPTGVLLQQRRAYHHYHHGYHYYGYRYHGAPAFSDVGPCGPGSQSEAFPNAQGFRCVAR
jgi:hypothetical protein